MEEIKKKLGRPCKPTAEQRTATPLYIKLTAAERKILVTAGYPQPTVWARDLLLRAARREV